MRILFTESRSQGKSDNHTLIQQRLMWKEFRQAMLDARQDREEIIGFLFCQHHQLSKNKLRYVPVSWIVPTSNCYEHQSTSNLVLKQSFHQYILDTYLSNEKNNNSKALKLDVVHVHTHFGDAKPSFSAIDDLHEAKYAKFLSSAYRNNPRLISGVFNELLEKSEFRIWDKKGIYHTPIEFYNSWFAPINQTVKLNHDKVEENLMVEELKDEAESILALEHQSSPQRATNVSNNNIASEQIDEIFARQKVFGDGVQQQLGQLKVALIGCGGIGAVFAEQLAPLGVKHWILVDPDRLETTNLNRMPAATVKMVDQWWHKVHYVKWLVKRVYTIGSHVRALPISVEDEAAKVEIAAADIIVVATDNHRSRQVAQELALQYTRPLICLGTHIEVKSIGQPHLYARITIPPLGGSWCLMCANIINLQQAALESAPTEIIDIAEEAGYIAGIDNPAVYWLNSICASTGVGVIHGMISGFLNVDSGLDWIYDFANTNWLKTNTDCLHTEDCYFCSREVLNSENKEVSEYFADNYIFG